MQLEEISIRRYDRYSEKKGLQGKVVFKDEHDCAQEVWVTPGTMIKIIAACQEQVAMTARAQAMKVEEAMREESDGILLLSANGDVKLDEIPFQ
jgi:hypothetical protein